MLGLSTSKFDFLGFLLENRMRRKPAVEFYRLGLYLTIPLIEVIRVEGLLLLHQGPGDDQELRRQLHPHLSADPFLPLTSPDLVCVIDDKVFVVQ